MLFILQMYREASSVAPLGPPLTQTPQPSQGAAGAFPSVEATHSKFGSFSKPNTHLTKILKVHSLALIEIQVVSLIVNFNMVVEHMNSCFITVEASEFLLFKKF